MPYTVSGQLVDKDKKPVEFAIVYTSDSSGKPISGSKNATTDDKGRWVLNGVNDSDYITGSSVGFNKKIISAKSIVPVNLGGIPVRTIQMTLPEDTKTVLTEVPVESKKVTIKPNYTGRYIMIAGAGLLLLTGAMFIMAKNKKLI